MSDLKVCAKCGWYEHGPHRLKECDPKAGDVVSRLMAAVPEVPSTKLGYGYRNFVFEADPSFHVRLEVEGGRKKLLHLREVWLLDDLSPVDAVDLVRTLAAWRKRQRDRR